MLPAADFVYRLSKVGSIFYKDAPKAEYQGLVVPELFEALQTKQKTLRRRWLPLKLFFNKGALLPSERNFSWWTPSVLEPEPVLPSAHKVGMPNGWVVVQSVLLRISADQFSRLRLKVPSPIDAFDSCIFLAPTVPGASIGRAIDLANHPQFKFGHPETVGCGIPVEIVEALPVKVDEPQRKAYPVDLVPMLPSLLDFYKSL